MPKLPQNLQWQDADERWAAIIEPVTSNPANNSLILKNITLINGSNVVNHLLGRPLQGWQIVRLRALATIYDTQDTNQMPQLTLNLVSNAAVVADIMVF